MERINATTGSYNFIDLFAGAGGLSEGFIQAGFSPVAHVEMNPYAAQTLETRTGYYYLKAQGKLDIYKDYISGKITRDEFLQHIPEEQLQSVFCETMSNETLPRLFENIDSINVILEVCHYRFYSCTLENEDHISIEKKIISKCRMELMKGTDICLTSVNNEYSILRRIK